MTQTYISPSSTCSQCFKDFDTDELNEEMVCSECVAMTGYCDCGDCSDTPIEQRPAPIGQDGEKITSLFFEGQQWTQRDYGTPYQAVRVWANGVLLGSLGYGYGYGSQFEYFALDFLHGHGLITEEMRKSPSWMLRNHGVTLYTSLSHVGKRDLVKSQDISENIARFATI